MKHLLHKGWASLETKTNLWLVIILLLGLGLRLTLPTSVTGSEGRSRWYRTAKSVAKGEGYRLCWSEYFPFCDAENDATAISEPAPVLAYAGLIFIFGAENEAEDLSAPAIVTFQTTLGLATTLLLYRIILHLFHQRRTALLGAFLWVTYIPMIAVERDLLGESVLTFLLALAMLTFLNGLDRGRAWRWALAGLFFGLATLSRSALLYLVPVTIILTLFVSPRPWPRKLANAAVLLVVFGLTLTPWIIRNAQVYNAFIPDNTLKGYNIYRHNHIIAGDNYLRYVFIKEMEREIQRRLDEGIRQQRTDVRGDENEYEMDRLYQQEALEIIKSYPGRYLLLSLYRIYPLLTDAGVRIPLTITWRLIGAETIVLFVLALSTVIRRRGRPYTMLPLMALILLFMAGHMLINARLRFLVPLMPYMIALAADQGLFLTARVFDMVKRGERVSSQQVGA